MPPTSSRARTAVVLLTSAALTMTVATTALAATALPGTTASLRGAALAEGVASGRVLAADNFARTVTGGLGTASAGGAWTTSGPAKAFSVGAGAATFALGAPGAGADAFLRSVAARDTETTLGLALTKGQTGGGTYVSVLGRQVVGASYALKLHYLAGKSVVATLVQVTSRVETPLASTTLTGLSYRAADVLRVRLAVSGTSPTTISAKVWSATGSEPAAWQLRATDATPALQAPGGIGLATYLSGSATNAPASVVVTDLLATAPITTITGGPADGAQTTVQQAAFTFGANRPGSSFRCHLDAAPWSPCTSPTSYTSLAGGTHSVEVQGVDADGHLAAPDSRTWTVDLGTTSITDGPTGHGTATAATFGFTASHSGSSFQCRLDGAAYAACASPASLRGLAVGSHTFEVRGVDADGTVASSDSRTWTVDPVVPVGPVRPGPTNTGVPAGTTLTRYDGDLTITTPGATIDALDIHGFVTVKAPNVTITRSIIRGGVATPGSNVGLVTNYSGTNFTIEDSELVPEHPSVAIDALKGWNFTARRLNTHGTVDGVKIHGDNVRLESSWIHDEVTYAADPYQGGGQSHNDGVQILGGNNITIVGNDVSGASNTALLITQDLRAATNTTISGNWFDGGNQSIGLMAKPLPRLDGLTLTGNRFGRNTRYSDCAIVTWGVVSMTASGNVWDSSDLPVRIRVG